MIHWNIRLIQRQKAVLRIVIQRAMSVYIYGIDAIVHTVVWIDQKAYLRMHFLETAKDTLAFHGFQSLPDYELFWQY